MLYFSNRDLRRRSHHRIEVARRLPINQIAFAVALPGLYECKISLQPPFHYVSSPVKLARLLTLGNHRSHSRRRIESWNPRAARTNPLRKSPLRYQIQLDGPLQHHIFEQLVLAYIGANVMYDLPRRQQQSVADSIHAHVVADGPQILGTFSHQRPNQVLRYPAQSEASNHDRR